MLWLAFERIGPPPRRACRCSRSTSAPSAATRRPASGSRVGCARRSLVTAATGTRSRWACCATSGWRHARGRGTEAEAGGADGQSTGPAADAARPTCGSSSARKGHAVDNARDVVARLERGIRGGRPGAHAVPGTRRWATSPWRSSRTTARSWAARAPKRRGSSCAPSTASSIKPDQGPGAHGDRASHGTPTDEALRASGPTQPPRAYGTRVQGPRPGSRGRSLVVLGRGSADRTKERIHDLLGGTRPCCASSLGITRDASS